MARLDSKKGHEFSIDGGFTYNFENPDTDYRNDVDSHIDWAASQFLNEQTHVGVVGYFFQQLSADSGSGAKLGAFKSRVAGIGPEIGYFFPMGKEKGYVNLKGYWEFAAQNRAEGFNLRGSNNATSDWFYNRNGSVVVLRIDGKKVSRTGEVEVRGLPEGAVFSPDGKWLYVGNFMDSDISVLRVDGDIVTNTGTLLELVGKPASMRGRTQ